MKNEAFRKVRLKLNDFKRLSILLFIGLVVFSCSKTDYIELVKNSEMKEFSGVNYNYFMSKLFVSSIQWEEIKEPDNNHYVYVQGELENNLKMNFRIRINNKKDIEVASVTITYEGQQETVKDPEIIGTALKALYDTLVASEERISPTQSYKNSETAKIAINTAATIALIVEDFIRKYTQGKENALGIVRSTSAGYGDLFFLSTDHSFKLPSDYKCEISGDDVIVSHRSGISEKVSLRQ